MRALAAIVLGCGAAAALAAAPSSYTNFETAHVHPIDLTPSGTRLLAVNTPDALLEVYSVQADGSLLPEKAIAVGLEPVTVVARSDTEAWVVNNLSDTVSVVDLALGVTTKTLAVGDEPTDAVFAGGKAFVAVSQEDAVRVYNLANLGAPPATVALAGRDVRALAVAADGQKIYAVVLRSGNQTTVVNATVAFGNNANLNAQRLQALGLRDLDCPSPGPPLYPPLPPGIARNPALTDPPASSNPLEFPPVGLIVQWDGGTTKWEDEAGQSWNHCLPYTLGDHDLFVIDVATLAVTSVDHLGTSLFEVSVNPASGKIYVPHTEARNFVRFEHPLGVQGHVVDNRLAVVDPQTGYAVTLVDLNAHIDRGSDPATNLTEREASISQPGMLVWKSDGSRGFLTAIGSRKLFRVDGGCLASGCIFGADRAMPDAVEVGEGPTGVALREAPQAQDERLYVLNRIGHSVAVVRADTLEKLDEIPLHDPSSAATRSGRRFLYDGIDSSGHGDAACSSCHLSGDMDGLAWDLGNPEGDLAPYTLPFDNVRFVIPQAGQPAPCDQPFCAAHDGFDPQKGPMVTQTLRGMLEPLHWRGDRPTLLDFNQAFVSLLGAANVGGAGGRPAGLSAADVELFRQFALEISFPPNPYRKLDDTTPCGLRAVDPGCEVLLPGGLLPGNPTEGAKIFKDELVDAGQPCKACHASVFGTAGGKLGGVEPAEPTTTDAAALFFGTADGSPHSDLKIPHLRNLYDKFGPVWAAPGSGTIPKAKAGFGFTHDGSFPDLFRFLSSNVFVFQGNATLQAQKARDVAAFLFEFPTGVKPAVGRQVTLPPGAPPTGSAADETLLAALIALGDLANVDRHCDLVASTLASGRPRHYHLSGGAWGTDVAGEPPLSTSALRSGASAPLTFTCATLGAGPRLGGDRDFDSALDGDDCAVTDPTTLALPAAVTDLALDRPGATLLAWGDQSASAGTSVRYDVLGGALSALLAGDGIEATQCLAVALDQPSWADAGADPPSGDGRFYLVRATNPCGASSLGPGWEAVPGCGSD